MAWYRPTKYQYVSWNDNVEGSSKRSDIKKTKLENQGYNLISTKAQIFSGLMVYKNPNYKTKARK